MEKIFSNKHVLTFALLGGVCSFAIYHLRKKINFSYILFSKKWFSEVSLMWPGQAFSLEIKKIIHQSKSKYQSIMVFESSAFGNVLVLDGVIQMTEKDECAYHEMMSHIPLTVHENAQNVLVVGGGDGGILRELCKHKNIKTIDICEIDEKVIEVSKKYLKTVSIGFDDKRVNVFINDANKFLENIEDTYDVIIIDSSDPIGPAEALFNEPFYTKVYSALKQDGICIAQCESMWIHVSTIKKMVAFTKQMFKHVHYANISVPAYPCGCIGLLCCSKSDIPLTTPTKRLEGDQFSNLKYYNYDSHIGSFKLPSFVFTEVGL